MIAAAWRRLLGRRRIGPPDPEALFARLAAAQGLDRYDEADRYRDFQRVFLSDPAGRRVLYQIFAWAHLFRTSVVPGDSHQTHVLEGERSLGLKILAALNADPGAAPMTADADPRMEEQT